MPTLAILGDVHGELERLSGSLALLPETPVDLALLVGDLGLDPPWGPLRETDRGRHDDSVRAVVARVRSVLGCPVAFVPGNHDLPEPAPDVEGLNADRRVVRVGGLSIVGLGGAGPTRFGFPYEWSESEAQAALDAVPLLGGAPDVFLCHAAPGDSALDRTHDGRHVGSAAVRGWITRVRPRLFLCGHIHEAWGLERLDGVPCVNAGALGVPCAQQIAWLVEWDGGPARIRSLRRREDGSVERRDWF